MRKNFLLFLSIFLILTLCSCDDESNEYETKEMLVTYKLEWYTECSFVTHNDENTTGTEIAGKGTFYWYELYIDSYQFVPEENMFFVNGDYVKITYNKNTKFDSIVYAKDLVKIERIKNKCVQRVDDNLIERNEKGYIVNINVGYITDEMLVINKNYIAKKRVNYRDVYDIYMSLITLENGEVQATFYAFNPETI